MKQFLEAGQIVNTHGVHGEVRIMPWADSPEFLTNFDYLYIDSAPVRVLRARVHKSCVIAALEGITDVDSAVKLKNKIVYINREDAHLENGQFFIQDIIGLPVYDIKSGKKIGTLSEVLTPPGGNVYVITGGEREHMIPAVPEFIDKVDTNAGVIRVKLIEGM